MSVRRRIALTQRADDVAGRDERRDSIDQAWTRLLGDAGCIPILVPNRIDDAAAYVDEAGVDALVLTGGNDIASLSSPTNAAPERDAVERALLAYAREREMPVLGVCRGMQMMVVDGGGTLCRVDGHVRQPHALTIVGGAVVNSLTWLRPGRVVNSFHDWAVPADGLGDGFVALATAPDGTVEAMAHRTRPQLGVMWHPERIDPETGTIGGPDTDALLGHLLGLVAHR